jgi:hypothetical protein
MPPISSANSEFNADAGSYRAVPPRHPPRPKAGNNMSKLREVLSLLIAAEPLPSRLKDHPLTGD